MNLMNSVILFFFISNNLTEMLNFPTRISDGDSHSLAVRSYLFYSGLPFIENF